MIVTKSLCIECIKHGVIPFIHKHHSEGNYKFWQDLESSHYAKEVMEYYRAQKIKFVEKLENLINVPVRAIEDFWLIFKGKVYENCWIVKDLDKLMNKIRLCFRK